jgi:hypothetical protein
MPRLDEWRLSTQRAVVLPYQERELMLRRTRNAALQKNPFYVAPLTIIF